MENFETMTQRTSAEKPIVEAYGCLKLGFCSEFHDRGAAAVVTHEMATGPRVVDSFDRCGTKRSL